MKNIVLTSVAHILKMKNLIGRFTKKLNIADEKIYEYKDKEYRPSIHSTTHTHERLTLCYIFLPQ